MNGPIRLQVFKGYTVDYRLREFRWIHLGEEPQWIPFDSKEGEALIAEMQVTGEFGWFNYIFHQNEREPGVKDLERRLHAAVREKEKRRKR